MFVTHESIKPFIDNDSTILILGSFPSIKTREAGFYYGHPQNRFYKVLSIIYKSPLPTSTEEKKQLLKEYHIALYDVIYSCDITSSADSSIKNVTPIDIKKILTIFPNIKRIILNGNKAKELFIKYLIKDMDTKNIGICYSPSTSPANAKMGVDQLVEIYSKYLLN